VLVPEYGSDGVFVTGTVQQGHGPVNLVQAHYDTQQG
ncbi:uncharacterized protein METZ01_LOCUS216539, partial [marine metagenome]